MAVQIRYDAGKNIELELTVGASVAKDTPLSLNNLRVYTLEAADASNKASCVLLNVALVVELTVTGVDGSGNSAVAVGQSLYRQTSGQIDKNTAGALIGYALAAVSSGASASILIGLT